MKKLAVFVATLLIAGSCAKYDEVDIVTMTSVADTLVASFEDVDTKNYVDENKKLHWSAADEISYFPNTNYNMQYRFKGETGDTSGTFQRITEDLVTGSSLDTDTNYALYPYALETAISSSGVIAYHFPATQTYAKNSFGLGANAMVAVTNGREDNVLRFKNVGGYLQLKLYGKSTVVQSIKLEGNNSEKLAGLGSITASYEGYPTTEMDASATTSVTLDCGDGVTLSSDSANPTIFWFVLPTVEFSEGFTVTITSNNGTVLEKSTNNSFTIKRNTIQPMAAIETTISSTPIPAANEIWYTNTSTTEPTHPNNYSLFGANFVSNIYDAEKECWVITFDGDVEYIENHAFTDISNLTSITIPNSVVSIGTSFQNCTALTSITIPNSVTVMGYGIFEGCSNLQSAVIGTGVTVIAHYSFKNCSSLKSVTIPDSLTSIWDEAFSGCGSLQSITIPDSVTEIRHCVFQGCGSLQNITIGKGVTWIGDFAFEDCYSLTRVDITDIAAWCNISYGGGDTHPCFNGAKLYLNGEELTHVTIPSDVTYIKDKAFYGCSSIRSVTISDNTTSIGHFTFKNCGNLERITMGDGITSIGIETFYGCSALQSVTLGNGVQMIENYAFRECTALESVTIPQSVTEIRSLAFYDCTSLASVYCKPTTPPIGDYHLFSCDNEDNDSVPIGCTIYVPASSDDSIINAYKAAEHWSLYADTMVEMQANNEIWYTNGSTIKATEPYFTSVFGANILSNTYDAKKECWVITFDGDVTQIGDNAFYYTINMTSIAIPESVTTIGTSAFRECYGLISVTIPDSVTEIKPLAFRDCTHLESVTIPDSVTEIGYEAFGYCTKLTTATIGNCVELIGEGVFRNCSSLASVDCKPTTPPTAGVDIFEGNASDRKIYVPASDDDSVINAYKTATNWSDYADYIEGKLF